MNPLSSDARQSLWWALAAVLAVRLVTLGLYPLTDDTEARYAEISRVMLESGEWITLQIQPEQPFWGKPPLYAWLTSASFAMFGIDEFSARLPHFLLSLVVLALLWRMVRDEKSPEEAVFALVILASTVMFFIAAGAVMTDMGLVLSTTLAMVSFWRSVRTDGGYWRWLFFASAALGLLAKGPVAVVLTVLAVGSWTLVNRRWEDLAKLPWKSGGLIATGIALPWYLAAEQRTPGFLHYFLVGEHFLRFVEPGWGGDLYGSAHQRLRGTIWWYWLLAALPWSIFVAYLVWHLSRAKTYLSFWRSPTSRCWRTYLLCWSLAPLLLFTFAGNILPTYVLPGLPAFAILFVEHYRSATATADTGIELLYWSGLAPIGMLVLLFAISIAAEPLPTERPLVSTYLKLDPDGEAPLYYENEPPMSAAFYSAGRVQPLPAQGNGHYWLATKEQGSHSPTSCRLMKAHASREYHLVLCTHTETR